MRRKLPYIIAAFIMVVPWLLALTWNASFEATPANTDLVSAGDDRIRELKTEIRTRDQVEHCFGSSGGTGCTPADNGHHREGSGLAFYENAAPAALLDPSATALAADDDGRLWIDADGLAAGTFDDRTLNVWNGSAWQIAHAEPLTPSSATVNEATIDNDQIFVIGTIDTAPANLVMTGGAGAGGLPMVTVPASGTWDITVFGGFIVWLNGGTSVPNTFNVVARLQQQVGAGAFATVGWCNLQVDGDGTIAADTPIGACTFSYIQPAGTASTAYTYRVRLSTVEATASAIDFKVDSTTHQIEGETQDFGYLKVKLATRL